LSTDKAVEKYEIQRVPKPGNPSRNEAWALIEAARRIAAVIQYGDLNKAEDREKLRVALRLNLRVWTIIQAEQLVGENQLPAPIRQNILTLCKFIDQHTISVMSHPSPERAVTLIDINRNIASGLLGNPEDDTPAETDTTGPSDSSNDDGLHPSIKLEA
tara:strand:- start:2574 stop:3050 length:477 start_codon:yes stop_codon:yes gene_type:complete